MAQPKGDDLAAVNQIDNLNEPEAIKTFRKLVARLQVGDGVCEAQPFNTRGFNIFVDNTGVQFINCLPRGFSGSAQKRC